MSQIRPSDEIERLDENVNGLFAKVGAIEERLDDLEDAIEEIRAETEDAKERATRAVSTARQIDEGHRADGGPSKTRKGMLLSRDEVVRRALVGTGRGGAVKAGEVIDMALPDVELDHRLVFNGWRKLTAEWDALEFQQRDDDDNRLVVATDDLTEELVAAVSENLSRDDLTERFNSRRS